MAFSTKLTQKARYADLADQHSRRAAEEGHGVFVWAAGQNVDLDSHPVKGMAEQIEAIEKNGWRLEHMTFTPQHGYLLFRRPVS
jgi:hypothetical protein